MSDSKCECSVAITPLGDGCRHCKPQEWIDLLNEWLDEERARVAELESALQDAVDIIQADANTEENYGSLCRMGSVLAKD
jgi:hypothetical protein